MADGIKDFYTYKTTDFCPNKGDRFTLEAGFKDKVIKVPWLENVSVRLVIPTDKRKSRLKEVLELCFEERKESVEDIPHFVGLQQIGVSI